MSVLIFAAILRDLLPHKIQKMTDAIYQFIVPHTEQNSIFAILPFCAKNGLRTRKNVL